MGPTTLWPPSCLPLTGVALLGAPHHGNHAITDIAAGPDYALASTPSPSNPSYQLVQVVGMRQVWLLLLLLSGLLVGQVVWPPGRATMCGPVGMVVLQVIHWCSKVAQVLRQ